jgi:hypothetical protein
VSLPWNKFIDLRMGPGCVQAELRRGWPRPVTLAQARREADDPSAEGVAAVVEELLQDLADRTPLAGAAINATLSSALLQFDVVTGEFAGSSDRQLHGVASACMAELLGDEAPDHDLRWQLQSDERHLLVCAMPKFRMAALEAATATHGLRLSRVAPAFIPIWNACARSLPGGNAVFAVHTGTELSIASVTDGVVAALCIAAPLVASDAGPTADAWPPTRPRTFAASKDFAASEPIPAVRFAFSPDRTPVDGPDDLDRQVDRLIAGLGRDPAAQSAFVLVCQDAVQPLTSPRWKTIEMTGARA